MRKGKLSLINKTRLVSSLWLAFAAIFIASQVQTGSLGVGFFGSELAFIVAVALLIIRGAMGILTPNLYLKTFKGFWFNAPMKYKFCFLALCAILWAIVALTATISPAIVFIVGVWGAGSLLLTLVVQPTFRRSPAKARAFAQGINAFLDEWPEETDDPYKAPLPCNGNHLHLNIGPSINPASGLPMVDGVVDTAGNPYGIKL